MLEDFLQKIKTRIVADFLNILNSFGTCRLLIVGNHRLVERKSKLFCDFVYSPVLLRIEGPLCDSV